MPKVGDRFYSRYFNRWGTVTRFNSFTDWYFRLDPTWLQRLLRIKPRELKAQSTPDKLMWARRDTRADTTGAKSKL